MSLDAIKVNEIRAIKKNVLVEEMNFRERISSGGIILRSDDGKSEGVRPRWGKVYAVGPEQTDVSVGQWILVAHGRWSRGVKIQDNNGERTIRMVDNKDILLISDTEPVDDTVSDSI